MAFHALRLITQNGRTDFAIANYKLFHVIMASDDETEEYWDAARYAIRGAFQRNADLTTLTETEKHQDILKFLDHHLGLQGTGEDHIPSIAYAFEAILVRVNGRPIPRILESTRSFNCTRPSFVLGMRSIMRSTANNRIREFVIRFIALVSDQWFNPPMLIMEPEDRIEFCENLARLMDTMF